MQVNDPLSHEVKKQLPPADLSVWEEVEAPVTPLTRERAEQIFGVDALQAQAITPARVWRWQLMVSVIASLMWSVLGKHDAAHSEAISAFLGGLICVLPSALFVFRVKLKAQRVQVTDLMVSEALKILATIALFVLVALNYKAVQWVPLLLTYVLAIKAYWLAFFVK